MSSTYSANDSGTEAWDQLYESLASQTRRMIIFSLMKEPEDRRLPLPDAARSASHELDTENLTVGLRHQHLPKLADAGYIRWESDPFTVSRGPHFAEPALVLDRMTESDTRYPSRLRDECAVIGEVTENASD